jgi:hypothetical protein
MRSPTSRGGPTRLLVPLTLALVVVIAGCGTSSRGRARTRTTRYAEPRDVTTSAPARDADLQLAVESFWASYVQIGGRVGPFDVATVRAALARHATGAELSKLLNVFEANAVAGYVIRGAIASDPSVVTRGATSAEVRDCYDDRTGLFRVTDGQRVDRDNPARHEVLMRLVLEGGSWKVASMKSEGAGCVG